MLAGWLVAGGLMAGAPHATAAPPLTLPALQSEEAAERDRLLIPSASRDLSAFRMDTEVFGWSADLREVGAVVMEVARGPLGRHRGEAYMLIYGVDEWVPRHNVITHSITHADMPHSPLPLREAKDFLWSIEWSYQHMWPHRPRRQRAKGDMEVVTLWTPLLTDEPGICRPWVSHRLGRQAAHRLMPYRPIDLTARCELLRRTDTRTYWATPTLAASMVRFDFAARPHNEESARFVLSSAWAQARTPQVEVHLPAGIAKGATVARLLRLLGTLAPTTRHLEPSSAGASSDVDQLWQADVRGGHDWLPLAIGALIDIGIHVGDVQAVDGPLQASRASAAPAARPSTPPASAARAPRGRPPRQSEPSRLQLALSAARHPRFGQDAIIGDAPGRLPTSLAGESGMVDDLIEQHDPIEDAFSDAQEPSRLPLGHASTRAARSPPKPDDPRLKGRRPVAADKAAHADPSRVRIELRLKGERPAVRPDASPVDSPKREPALDGGRTQDAPQPPRGQFLRDWSP